MNKELFITRKMRGKMTGMHSLNTSPMNNPFCQKKQKNPNNICSKCYSIKALTTYLQKADHRWIDNGVLLSEPIPRAELPTLNSLYFRFHAHGELLNYDHYRNLANIALENPKIRFVLWSKRTNLVREGYRPNNLSLVYSNSKINPVHTTVPYPFQYSFNVFTKDYIEEHDVVINCESRCLECLKCYSGGRGIEINEVIKR